MSISLISNFIFHDFAFGHVLEAILAAIFIALLFFWVREKVFGIPDLSGKWSVNGETIRHHNHAIIGTKWSGIIEIEQKGDAIAVNLETNPNGGTQSRSYAVGAASITSIGRSAVADARIEGGNVNQHVCIIRVKPDELSPCFLNQYLISHDGQKQIDSFQAGGNRQGLNFEQIRLILIPLPAVFTEQQKIADCLSSLDELIAAETQKLDALKIHKKGLMQQLFPREGETVPRLRFPEFQEEREWEEVMLGEIAEIKLGKMLDSKKHTTGTLLPYLNNLAVRWNEVNTSNLPKMYFDKDELDRFGLMDGDVVVCEGGEPGRSAVWDGRLPDLKFQKAVHRVRFKVPFEPRLLVLFLESIAGTPRLESLFTGGGIKHLTQEVFARLKIPFTTHAEQQRISGCLASLDDLIIAQAKKIDIFKTQKQGLMQQLFPVLDEVSA